MVAAQQEEHDHGASDLDHDVGRGEAQAALVECLGQRRGHDQAGRVTPTVGTVTAFVVAFAGSVALWWIYFDRGARLASDVIAACDDPGRLGRSAYTYFHVPMVAGIIVTAIADELRNTHPAGDVTAATGAVILGGPGLHLAQRPVQVDRVRTLVVVTGRAIAVLAVTHHVVAQAIGSAA